MGDSLALKKAKQDQADALRDVLRQIERAGTPRRALLLHVDRLPAGMDRPHHQRLARAAISSMANADRVQFFELSRGRQAIIWRGRGSAELEPILSAIELLLADLPPEHAIPVGQLISVYDLPAQGAWLLDELVERPHANAPHGHEPVRKLNAPLLGRLEQSLAQADLTRFIRWRPVVKLQARQLQTAWEMRYVCASDLAASLCPEHRIKAEPWLFRRLTRSFDRRMLAMLTNAQELRGAGPFSLHLNVATILSAEFLRFDAALPASLRGEIVLNLTAPDVLADAASFTFARNFARSRGYRLLLRDATTALLAVFDVAAAEFDLIDVPLTSALAADPDQLRLMLPPSIGMVLSRVDLGSELEWARAQGFVYCRGRAALV